MGVGFRALAFILKQRLSGSEGFPNGAIRCLQVPTRALSGPFLLVVYIKNPIR